MWKGYSLADILWEFVPFTWWLLHELPSHIYFQGQGAGGDGQGATNLAPNKYTVLSRLRERVANKLKEPERRSLLIKDFETNPPKPLQVREKKKSWRVYIDKFLFCRVQVCLGSA